MAATAVVCLGLAGCGPEVGVARASAWTSTRTVPLPKAALLKAQPAPNCALKTASLDPARQQPADPPSANDADPDVALRAKLDCERRCYRHADLIARERLQKLQETVRALKRDGRVASGPAD